MREAKTAAWFLFVVGAGVSLPSAWAAVILAPQSTTKSLLRDGLAQVLKTALGEAAGHVAYHLFWTALGSCVAYLALHVLKDQSRQGAEVLVRSGPGAAAHPHTSMPSFRLPAPVSLLAQRCECSLD